MSAEINDVLCGLSDKFEQLVSLCEKTRVEYSKVQQDNRALIERRQEQESRLAELEEKNKRLLITQAFTAANGNSEEAKEKISKIVRDIDKCITLLTK
jgi:cell shape-determining protein MreC